MESYIDLQQRAFYELKAENNKGRGADQEKLAKINGELNEYEDAATRHKRETLSAQLTRDRHVTDSRLSTEALEYKETFWTWARHGFAGRSDPLQALGFGGDPEGKWAEARRRTGGGLEAKGMSLADDTSGGVLTPPGYIAQVIKASIPLSPTRP